MVIRKAISKVARKGKKPSAQKAKPRPRTNPNARRKGGRTTGFEAEWGEFIERVEKEIDAALMLTDDLSRSPYYSHANVVKRAVYKFIEDARRQKVKPQDIEDTIDASRVAHAGSKTLRRLQKDFKKEPYFWVLTGLHIECPDAKLRKSDVTRFAQHLNYARRHRVPPEFLIGFLMQTGSNAEVYRRALDRTRREPWFIEKGITPAIATNMK